MFGANNYLPIFSLGPIRGGRPVSMGRETRDLATLSRRKNILVKKWPTRKFFFVHGNWRRRRRRQALSGAMGARKPLTATSTLHSYLFASDMCVSSETRGIML